MNGTNNVPANSVRRKEMAKELSNNAKTVGLEAVNSVVVFDKRGLEKLVPHAIDLAETLTNQAKEFVICSFLRTTFDNHRRELMFQTWRQVDA
jgi:hypothetical protein